MIDFVFPYILPDSRDNGEELKYALRSIEKCFSDFRIWIIGEKPSWITNIQYIQTDRKQTAWEDVNFKIYEIINNEAIGEDFILMNDDFYFINDVSYEYLKRYRAVRKLDENSVWENSNVRGQESLRALNKTYIELRKKYLSEPGRTIWDFETHLPRVFNKSKLISLYKDYDLCNNQLAIATLYFNIYSESESPIIVNDRIISNDTVLRFRSDTIFKLPVLKILISNKRFISNSAPGFETAKLILSNQFTKKSSFEK
jgi:hypothetical protein